MTTHTCEDHGHHCSICEEERLAAERLSEIRATVDSWNWNASIFDIYEVLKEMDEEDQADHLRIACEVIPSGIGSFQDLALHLDVEIPGYSATAPELTQAERKKLWAENGEYRRRCALKQAIDWLNCCEGRMIACRKDHPGQHEVSVREVPEWVSELQKVYDEWPEVTQCTQTETQPPQG